MNYPPNYGYPPPRPPPPSGPNVLLIVLIVLIVALVLGGGGCLLCIGIAASTAEPVAPSITTTAATATAPAIAATPPAKPLTATGTRLLVVELFPSWPVEFQPQHWTPPAAVSAQV